MTYVQQTTLQYKTFVKRGLVEALQAAWANHPDRSVSGAKVAIDFTRTDFKLPAVIIKFYESQLPNAGVGHYEWLPYPLTADPADTNTVFVQYQHRLYKGDIEFEIFGQSSADRDILSDALIETLAMDEVSASGLSFINRFYNGIQSTPYGQWHFPTLNTDEISGYGENTMPPPWSPEDDLVYQTSYRVPIFGEFYSYTPPEPTGYGPVAEVDVYEWPVDAEGNAIDPLSPAPPVPSDDYQKFTGEPAGEEDI
jgi:hypothetical protein